MLKYGRILIAGLFSIALLYGCGGGGDPVAPAAVPSAVSLDRTSLVLHSIGQTESVRAAIRDQNGEIMTSAGTTWSSDNPSVASVSGSGNTATISAVGRGAAVITVRTGSVSSGMSVLVRTAFDMSVSPSGDSLRVGNTLKLLASVSADDGAPRTVVWSSASNAIATVNAEGIVTGISQGNTIITARSTSDPSVSASAAVVVTPPRGVMIAPEEVRLGTGETKTFNAALFIESGVSRNISWRSSDPSTATVSQLGEVTGVAIGSAQITAVSVADTSLRATAQVNIAPVVRKIELAPNNTSIHLGQSVQISASVTADDGVSQNLIWLSDNSGIISVDTRGNATAVSFGETTIRAKAVSDTSREGVATFAVVPRPVSLVFATRMLGLTAGQSSRVSASVAADPGISTQITWNTRDPSIASVSPDGLITAGTPGSAWLIAEPVADPNKRDSILVKVAHRLANSWYVSRLGGPLIEDVISLWAMDSSTAFAINEPGDIFRYDGRGWMLSASGRSFGTSFKSIHGVNSTSVTAVGANGTIVRFNGTSWVAQESGTSSDLLDVWMTSNNSAWASGQNGTILRLAGNSWSIAETGTTKTLNGIWANDTTAYAVGESGEIRHWQSGTWMHISSGTDKNLRDVWGSPVSATIYAVGDAGTVIRRSGQLFSPINSGTDESLLSISGNNSDDVVIAGSGVVLHRNKGAWVDLIPPYETRFHSVFVDISDAMWLGGQRGLVTRREQDGYWNTLSLTPDLLDVWSSGPRHSIAVGELGFVFRWNGNAWLRDMAPTLERLNTVWSPSSQIAFAGGDNGTLLEWDGSVWSSQLSPTVNNIYAMWGASSSNVWAVTDGGDILNWDGTEWQIEYSYSDPLYGIYGNSDSDIIAVGVNGAVLHYDGIEWSETNSDSQHLLVGIWMQSKELAFTAGAKDVLSGVLLRYNGSDWTEEHTGSSRIMSSVWGTVASDVYAVGDMGTIMRFNGLAWQTMVSGTQEFLWAVTGSPDGTGAGFAVGLNGTLVSAVGTALQLQSVKQSPLTTHTKHTANPSSKAKRSSVKVLPSGKQRKTLN